MSARHCPPDPSPLPKRGPIYNVPVEIFFQLVAPPRTRDGLYHLSELTPRLPILEDGVD